jgi:hypothetical protein
MINLQADQNRVSLYTATRGSHLVAVPGSLSVVVNPRMTRLIIAAGLGVPGNLRVVSGQPGEDLEIAWNAAAEAVDYLVEIHDGDGLRLDFTTNGLGFTYSAVMQANDGGARRSYTIKVAAHNPAVGRSEYVELVAENAAPAAPSGLRVVEQFTNFIVSCENAKEADYSGMIIWADTSSGVPTDDLHKVYDSGAQSAVIMWDTDTPSAYFKVARYDTFGKTDLNISSEVAGTLLPTSVIPSVDVEPGTTYLASDVVFYTGNDSLYRWDMSLDPDAYVRAEPIVVADQIYSIDLKAMSAVIGELTLGEMNVDASGYIRGGQASFDNGTGFFLGYEAGEYVFSLGDSAGENIKWDGTSLTISGALNAATGTFAGELSAVTGSFDDVDVDGSITVSATGNIKGGQTAYNTGEGFFLGYSGGEYKFSLGDPSGSYLIWDGTNLSMSGSLTNTKPYTTGTYCECSSTGIVTGTNTTYVTAKEISVSRGGTATFKFSARIQSGGAQGQARIYINGSAAGTYRTFGSTLQEWSEDLSISAGDSITVECRNSTTGSVWAVHSFALFTGATTGNAVAVQ